MKIDMVMSNFNGKDMMLQSFDSRNEAKLRSAQQKKNHTIVKQ